MRPDMGADMGANMGEDKAVRAAWGCGCRDLPSLCMRGHFEPHGDGNRGEGGTGVGTREGG